MILTARAPSDTEVSAASRAETCRASETYGASETHGASETYEASGTEGGGGPGGGGPGGERAADDSPDPVAQLQEIRRALAPWRSTATTEERRGAIADLFERLAGPGYDGLHESREFRESSVEIASGFIRALGLDASDASGAAEGVDARLLESLLAYVRRRSA